MLKGWSDVGREKRWEGTAWMMSPCVMCVLRVRTWVS